MNLFGENSVRTEPRLPLPAARTDRDGWRRMKRNELETRLNEAYTQYNRPEYIHPDPLECLYHYGDTGDREVAGLIAASLAYGRVGQILNNVRRVLKPMGRSPRAFLIDSSRAALKKTYDGFKHRWTTEEELTAFLTGIGRVLGAYGSLEEAFGAHHKPETGSTLAGLTGLVREIKGGAPRNSLLPDPAKQSACKRLHLYLRWMVRKDAVDPGCWTSIDRAHLIVPLDTHLYRICKALGMTRRKQPNLPTALEITQAFKKIVPEDPLRYDFALTRFGIRQELDPAALLGQPDP